MRRDAHEGNGGGILVEHVGGRGIQPALLDARELGKGSLPAGQALVRAPHTVAGLEALRLGANRFDNPREIGADDERQRQVHFHHPGANVGVDRVDRDGADPDEHFARARLRLREVAIAE